MIQTKIFKNIIISHLNNLETIINYILSKNILYRKFFFIIYTLYTKYIQKF